jgi:hypothetical protein
MTVKTFIPPICNLIVKSNRKVWWGKLYTIIKEDGKEYLIVWKYSSYDKKNKILTIKPFGDLLPTVFEIEQEFYIDNTWKW